jgi:hypothetical protein
MSSKSCLIAICFGLTRPSTDICSNHTLNTGHTYNNRIITDTMDVTRTRRKRRFLNILERYDIYQISRNWRGGYPEPRAGFESV